MSAIYTVTALPLGLLIAIAAVCNMLFSNEVSINALAGGLAILVPNVIFAGLAFRHAGAQNAQNIVRSFYLGEALKILMTAGLLVCVFIWVEPIVPAALFGSLVAMQVANGVAATRIKKLLPNRRR